MKNKHGAVIERLETIVAELECEFLYLLNDLSLDAGPQTQQLRHALVNVHKARCFLAAAAAPEATLIAAE